MFLYRAKIEDNKDPENLQRLRVRIHGVHSLNESEVPSDVLPWAKPVLSPSDGAIDGGYGCFDVPENGDFVWVFFEDEEWLKQRPIYLGTIRTPNDKNSEYKQGENKVIIDRWKNRILIDKNHTNFHNGSETIEMDLKETGEFSYKMIGDTGGKYNKNIKPSGEVNISMNGNSGGDVNFNVDPIGNVNFEVTGMTKIASLYISVAKDIMIYSMPGGTIGISNSFGSVTLDPIGNINIISNQGLINLQTATTSINSDSSGNIIINSSTSITINSPIVNINGKTNATGPVIANAGLTTQSPAGAPIDMITLMTLLKTHTHPTSTLPTSMSAELAAL